MLESIRSLVSAASGSLRNLAGGCGQGLSVPLFGLTPAEAIDYGIAARGSRLAARGSRLAARGSRLAARGSRLTSLRPRDGDERVLVAAAPLPSALSA